MHSRGPTEQSSNVLHTNGTSALGCSTLLLGGFREKKFLFAAILILALPSILSLILYLVNQGEFSIQQDKKI